MRNSPPMRRTSATRMARRSSFRGSRRRRPSPRSSAKMSTMLHRPRRTKTILFCSSSLTPPFNIVFRRVGCIPESPLLLVLRVFLAACLWQGLVSADLSLLLPFAHIFTRIPVTLLPRKKVDTANAPNLGYYLQKPRAISVVEVTASGFRFRPFQFEPPRFLMNFSCFVLVLWLHFVLIAQFIFIVQYY